MWSSWFVSSRDAGPLAVVVYDPWLVTVSVALACLGGMAAMQLVAIARRADLYGRVLSRTAFGLATVTLGGSVWSMHFVGMLAVDICQPVRYDAWITALSVVPALLASAAGLRLYLTTAVGDQPRRILTPRLMLSGLAVGAGIGAMHYTGMTAMRMDSILRYDPLWFVLSIVVAVVLAIAGLAAYTLLRRRAQRLPRWVASAVAGILLGLAISGMHYTAMQASLFIGETNLLYVRWSDRQWELASGVALATVVVFGAAWGTLGLVTYRVLLLRLRDREQLLRDVVDNLPGAVIRLRLDESLTRTLVSRGVVELLGRDPEAYRRGEWTLESCIVPEDRPVWHDGLHRALDQPGHSAAFTVRAVDSRQGLKWLAVRVHSVPSAFGQVLDIFLLDVTSETMARERERVLIAAIDAVIGRALLSPEGVFTFVNEHLAATLGYEPHELLNQPHALLWSPDTSSVEMEAFWAALRRGEPRPGEIRRRAKDGSIRHFSAWYQPIRDANGRVTAVLKLAVDITDRVNTLNALQQAQRDLEQALLARSQFFANVSHEIRTPMNSVVGFGELLRDSLPEGPQREQARLIVEAARSLLRILNDLLDAAKLERGEFVLESAPFQLDRLLASLVSQFGVLAGQKGLLLRLDMAADMPVCWLGDRDRVRQMLVNLLGNAIKFTERGHVTLGADVRDGQLHLWVQDTGIGIAPERQAVIFDPFVQADSGTARRYGGTGLGMAIVKRLAELMNGEVKLHSTPGQGTCVTLRLPLAWLQAQQCDEETVQPSVTGDATPASARLRLLAADDMAQNRQLLQALVQREGHEVRVFEDGEALYQVYTADPSAWDAILLDLYMPNWDGFETCRRLRLWERDRGRPAVPVYALTASVSEDDRSQAAASGIEGILEKPIDVQALRRLLYELAQRKTGAASASQPSAETSSLSSQASVGEEAEQAAGATVAAAPPQPVDVQRGRQLWGEEWSGLLLKWVEQQCQHWVQPDLVLWQHSDWHRIAGVAANLAAVELELAARQAERASRAGLQPDIQAAWQAWQRLLQWARAHRGLPQAQATSPDIRSVGSALRADLNQQQPECVGDTGSDVAILQDLWLHIKKACEQGELPEALLGRLCGADPQHARALRAALDEFDFERAQQLCEQRLRDFSVVQETSDVHSTDHNA